jgi:hypothetical protein
LERIRARLTYANVMATIAVFIALGGVAWGAATIGSSDVIDDTLKSHDVRNDALKSHDLRNGKGVKDKDVLPNSLSGAAIDESSLGQVPSAEDADTLGGAGPDDFVGSDQILWASVSADGSLARGSAGMSSLHNVSHIDGLYLVQLPAGYNAIACTYVGSIGRAEYNADTTDQLSGAVSAAPYTGNQSDIRYVIVQTRTLDGTKADLPFHLIVVCP